MDELTLNLNRFWVGSEIGFSSINFELKGNLLWHKSLYFLSWFDCTKIPSAFNEKYLRPIIKNSHFIGFKSLVYSILVTFFRLKKPKDTEVFLALKIDELI
jgi:hypothetical protein